VTEPTDPSRDIDPLTRTAIAWVVRLRSGVATKADLADLQQWRDQSPEHDKVFRQAAVLWRDLKQTADKLADERKPARSRFRGLHPGSWSVSRRAFVGSAVAASAAVYFAYDPPMDLWPSLGELTADYRTDKGEKRELALDPGVTVTLGTLTSLSVLSSSQKDPRLELISGEAAFSAKRRSREPLVVQVLGARIVATQASFNMRCVDGRGSATCLDGRLDVEYERRLVELAAGQQVNFSRTNGLGLAEAADTESATAWQHELLIVRDRPLAEVVDEVNRYRAGRIIITNAALGRRLVNGTFHLERLGNFPAQIRELFGAGVHALPGGVVLLT